MSSKRESRPSYSSRAVQVGLFPSEPIQIKPKSLSDSAKSMSAVCRSLSSAIDTVTWVTDGEYGEKQLKLFDDVSQVYELLLARMEFLTIGHDLSLLCKRAAYFEEVNGNKSHHYFLSNVRGKGQIGHSNQYLVHWFYPYKGKFHGQMIKALLNFMGVKEDSLVLDPFVGSGTTLVECAVLGIPSVGIDINPALCMVSQIKVDSLDIDYPEFQRFLAKVKLKDIFEYFSQTSKVTGPWFLGFSQMSHDAKLLLAEAWEERFPPGFVKSFPDRWRNLLLLCYLHALSDYTYLQRTKKAMPLENFFSKDMNEYLDTLSGTHRVISNLGIRVQPPKVLFGTALELPLESSSVDGIVTSPPYSIALDYVKNDEHLLDYLGIDVSQLRHHMVGLKGRNDEKLRLYRIDMKKSLEEMYRVLKPGCYIAMLLGDVVVGAFRTNFAKEIVLWSKEIGFSEAELIRRPILGGYARLRYEYIILLRK